VPSPKDSRIAMRLTTEQDAVIRRAADLQGTTITEFAVAAAISRAHDVLADQRLFTLDAAAFAEFHALLDQPVTHKPHLEKLFASRSMFEE